MVSSQSKPRWRIFRVLQLFVIAYLLVVLAVLIFQRRLIYFPTKIAARIFQPMIWPDGFFHGAKPCSAATDSMTSAGILVAK